jgi:FtsZ-interacting cell division protein ZipA
MFAVFPGPVAAPQAFDELVATGRRLAERLGAVLQDDTGQSLSGPRLQTIREELMNFESLATLARSGRRPD